MATPIFCCGGECGVAVSTVNSTPHWSTGATFSTSTVRSGSRSLRVNLAASSGGANNVTGVGAFGGTVLVVRGYLNFTTLPDTNFPLLMVRTAVGSEVGAVFQSSDSKIYSGLDNSGTLTVGATGISVSTGQWYRVDILVDVHANPWTVDVKIEGTSLGQASIAAAASTISVIRQGRTYAGVLTTTVDYFLDDLLVSATSGDYPLGAGYVNHFVPTADGTHNIAGTGDFQRTLTGTDILNATTTAFQLIDEVPLEATVTDWINMVAPPNATDYVECVFGPAPGISTPTTAPRAVEVICGINQAGTGSGNMELRLNDNGTTGVIYTATGVAGVAVASGQVFKRAHFADPPSAASAWTLSGNGNFNDVRIRFGSPAAVDANPDQYLGCAMIEAEFAEVSATPLTQTAADDANNLADALTKQLNVVLTQTQADTLTAPTDALVLGLGLVFAETITVATDGLVVGHGMVFADNASNLADALNKTIGYEVPLSDDANTLADSEAHVLGVAETLADTLAALADAYAQLLVYLLALSDTQAANWADAHQLLLAQFLALADSYTLTDTTVIRMEQRVDFTDTLNSLSDAVASQLGTALELTDSITVLTDSYTHTLGYSITSSDTLVITDSLGIGHGLITSDTIALTDSATVVMEFRLSFSDDTNTLADSVVVQLSQALDLSDSFILVDSETTTLGFNQLFTDSVNNLADAATNVLGQLVQFSDDINLLADAHTLTLGLLLNFSEQLTVSDSATLLMVHLLNLSDDTNFIADSIDTSAPQGPQRQVGVTDALAALSDEVTLRLDYLLATSDTIVLTDAVAVAQGLLATFTDSFTLTDSTASTLGHLVPLTDALTLTDSSQRGLGYETSYSDSLVLTDAAAFAEGQRLQLTDNAANWADSVVFTVGLAVIISDNAQALTDDLTALLSHLLRLSDSFTLTDALATFGENYLTISDSFVLTDDIDVELRGPDFNYDFADSLVLTDAIALSLGNELQLQLVISDAIQLSDHYFDLRRPYASSAKRHVVVPSRARVTIPTTSRVVVVPAKNRTTEVD